MSDDPTTPINPATGYEYGVMIIGNCTVCQRSGLTSAHFCGHPNCPPHIKGWMQPEPPQEAPPWIRSQHNPTQSAGDFIRKVPVQETAYAVDQNGELIYRTSEYVIKENHIHKIRQYATRWWSMLKGG